MGGRHVGDHSYSENWLISNKLKRYNSLRQWWQQFVLRIFCTTVLINSPFSRFFGKTANASYKKGTSKIAKWVFKGASEGECVHKSLSVLSVYRHEAREETSKCTFLTTPPFPSPSVVNNIILIYARWYRSSLLLGAMVE